MSAVWHIAALSRMKKLPKLKAFISGRMTSRGRRTADEQIAIAHQWTSRLQALSKRNGS